MSSPFASSLHTINVNGLQRRIRPCPRCRHVAWSVRMRYEYTTVECGMCDLSSPDMEFMFFPYVTDTEGESWDE